MITKKEIRRSVALRHWAAGMHSRHNSYAGYSTACIESALSILAVYLYKIDKYFLHGEGPPNEPIGVLGSKSRDCTCGERCKNVCT